MLSNINALTEVNNTDCCRYKIEKYGPHLEIKILSKETYLNIQSFPSEWESFFLV